MPDITMCSDVTCHLRDQCFRYTATPDDLRQSWFAESPRDKLTGACTKFLPNETAKRKK